MDICTRHAFTDGQCVNYGCKDCPAEIYIPADKTPMGRYILRTGRLTLLKASAIILAIFLSGYAGAAITAQGFDNWSDARVAHVQP